LRWNKLCRVFDRRILAIADWQSGRIDRQFNGKFDGRGLSGYSESEFESQYLDLQMLAAAQCGDVSL
jgi:hypothetical protein